MKMPVLVALEATARLVDGSAVPHELGTVIRLNTKIRERSMDILVWGLLPHDAVEPVSAPRPIHARAETVAEKPMFADSFRRRRAIVPADRYTQRARSAAPRAAGSRFSGRMAGQWLGAGSGNRSCNPTAKSGGHSASSLSRPPGQSPRSITAFLWRWNPRTGRLWPGEVDGDRASLLRPPGNEVLRCEPVDRNKPASR
jgi:hypothetical protein